jgi:hypothetical protein
MADAARPLVLRLPVTLALNPKVAMILTWTER